MPSRADEWVASLTAVKNLEPVKYVGTPGAVVTGASVSDAGGMRLETTAAGRAGPVVFEISATEVLALMAWMSTTFGARP